MIHRFLLFTLLVVLSALVPALFATAQETARPLTFSGPRFLVEDLTADFHADGRLLVVAGKIKNLSFTKVRGYVTVYLKNAHQDVIRAVEVEVNDNHPILTGQAAPFETTANIEGIKGLANVSVEFVETNRGNF